jgi:hypothetical protein
MAKQTATPTKTMLPQGTPDILFPNPYAGQAGVPDGLNTYANSMANAYRSAYGNHSWASQHPILTGIAGLALGGPAGAIALPMAAKNNDTARHAELLKSFQDFLKNSTENQKNIDDIAAPRNNRDMANTGLQTEINAGRINPNTPMLNPNAVYSSDYLKDYQERSLNPASLGLMDSLINNQQQQSFNQSSQPSAMARPEMPAATQSLPPIDGGQEPLRGGVARNYKALNTTYDPNELPTSISNTTFGNLQQAQTSAATNALTVGEQRYNTDQEAPKRAAEVAKLYADIQKAASEGRAADALAGLRKLQTVWYPKLTQSEINRNNRPPAGPNPPQPTVASELSRLYSMGAFGAPGSPQAMQTYSAILSKDPETYTTQTSYTRDNNGHVVSSSSKRIPAGRGASPTSSQAQPTGGIRLPSGRMFNP